MKLIEDAECTSACTKELVQKQKDSQKAVMTASQTLLEYERLHKMFSYERQAKEQGYQNVCGVDEVGRGPLAGPVVACACVLPQEVLAEPLLLRNLDDSKKLLPELREKLFHILSELPGIQFGIGIADHKEIDEINIFQASLLAMKRAIQKLICKPCLLLVDGKHGPKEEIPVWKIVKGDQLSLSIAAASVIAKVTRDRLMVEYDKKWPGYGFNQHKGYSTPDHFVALDLLGPCPIHRSSFAPVRERIIVNEE